MGKIRPGSDEVAAAADETKDVTQQQFGATKVTKHRNEAKPKAERKNTAIYVTSLPLDVTVEEVSEKFSRYGLIAEEIDTGAPRIKLYTNEDGSPKGDALIVYFRPESVHLAIQMLDESEFRHGVQGPDGLMRVKEAERTYKKQQDVPAGGAKSNMRDKQKIIQKTQKLNSRLADWDDDDPSTLPVAQTSKWDKLVILKHMFTIEELAADVTAALDIKEDIRTEAEKVGEVTHVVLYDLEPEGIASVKFTDPEAAKACAKMMAGRVFEGQTVEAYIPKGAPKFKKSKDKTSTLEDVDSDEERRANEFGDWLEGLGKEKVAT